MMGRQCACGLPAANHRTGSPSAVCSCRGGTPGRVRYSASIAARRFGHVSEACSRAGTCIRCSREHPPGRRYLPSPLRQLWRGASSRHANLSSLARGAESGHTAGHGTNATLETGGQGRSTRGVPRGSLLRCCGQGQPSRELHQGTRPAAPHSSAAPFHTATVSPSTTSPPPSPPAELAQDPWDALIASLLAAQRAVGDALPPEHPLRVVCLAALSGQSGTTLLN
ncbi:hypothetical protein HPB51_029455 [Rhipicephalus microplus]|uniref:Uncharacterized protein n=1 Tax=Rhipicephalus microplus TaxID=6941 RepID=A0A9J6CUL9_RHIMP|nr:hypothetical protein HPB51_029455 [Rhipicephalus microplus]